MSRPAPPPLALTMGEPAGIGGELTLKAWLGRTRAIPPFFVIADAAALRRLARRLGLAVPVAAIDGPELAPAVFPEALPVLPQPLAVPVTAGRLEPLNAPPVIDSIRRAVELVRAGRALAVVTNPVHKRHLYEAGFHHPGHTEFLAELAGANEPPVMMLACRALKVVPVTVHLPLRQAIESLSTELIVSRGRITAAALREDFGIEAPRLAVAGLNPHAGEDGTLGREETLIIEPAVAALKALGLDVTGPAPADSLFHARARQAYDAVLCMYHDQALLPLKTIDFRGAVNTTLGLPFVRTSPDHGTALDIAGKGVADPTSLLAALRMAGDIARRRRTHAARRRARG
ncbi:MAG: 4-hydroxythreonine-4-phosphate dehydrogenase PdxA [Kiloniellales bacterium]